jgi:hypothetical protein
VFLFESLKDPDIADQPPFDENIEGKIYQNALLCHSIIP